MVVSNTITAANLVPVGSLICSDAWQKVTQREVSANGHVILYAFCSRTTDTSGRPLNELTDAFTTK